MKTTRRTFLGTSAAAAQSPVPRSTARPDAVTIARRHPILRKQPTPDFFEGILLGNGDIGVCVTVRPDALGLHIGKNDSWDIRVSEDHVAHVKPFAEVLKMWQQAGDEAKRRGQPEMTHLESNIDFFREYSVRTQTSYRKSWPRPWPCGIVWVHWDSRMVRVVEQKLDIAAGVLRIQLEHDDLRGAVTPIVLTCFVSREANHISLSSDRPLPVLSVDYLPNRDAEAKLPDPKVTSSPTRFFCYQHFPATAPTEAVPNPPASDEDSGFALDGIVSATTAPLRLDIAIFTRRETKDPAARAHATAETFAARSLDALRKESAAHWSRFWAKSAVSFTDPQLEAIWYHNQYFLACCLKPGVVAPGLFGNWTSGRIGTAWHGDYHMNYNTQQVWWGVFSSNHAEQHEPYTRLVESLMPMAEWNARVQFGLPGAYFPHSAYPVPSKVNPYPAPPWGYEICETPWTVQSLWWEYLYTLDEAYLRRVYPMLRAATEFLTAFLTKGEDGKYHVIPTVSPENWGATVDYRLNKDCIIDIALTEFLLDAMLEASRVLHADAALRPQWENVRRSLAPYPEVDGPFGKVWLDVLNAPPEYVYNVPVTLAPVFPAEQVGIGKRPEMWEIARRTARTVRLEGGNDLVWQPLARARLGMLDLAWFKREVAYSMTPLGIANDRVRQIGGRYRDQTHFDYMMRMGVWTENLSLPAVLNECLLQSYAGVIRLFPNTQNLGPAAFRDLRAAGAFLVSASWDGRTASAVTLRSEKGAPVRLLNPWPKRKASVTTGSKPVEATERDGILEFPTTPGAVYTIEPARA